MSSNLDEHRRLSRREFFGRVAKVTLAAAVAERTYGLVARPTIAAGAAIPTLDAAGAVAGVAGKSDGLVAVGCDGSGAPVVWTYKFGAAAWSKSADSTAFLPGTELSGIAAMGDTLLAGGAIIEVNSLQKIIDEQGQPSEHLIESSTPAIYSSEDGIVWQPVLTGVAGSPWGGITAIASAGDGSSVVAIGSSFMEPGPLDPVDLIGMGSTDGRSWARFSLDGIDRLVHGAVTLLASTGTQLLVGTTDVEATDLYVGSEVGGSWKRILAPTTQGRVSFVAAAGTTDALLLAAIDGVDQSRVWQRAGEAWKPVSPPAGVPAGGKLLNLELIGGSLVGTGSDHGGGFVAALGV
jgi:hypothetical protein